jgi:hypothetical protein
LYEDSNNIKIKSVIDDVNGYVLIKRKNSEQRVDYNTLNSDHITNLKILEFDFLKFYLNVNKKIKIE